MKKNKPFGELFYRSLKKILLTMRIVVILMILGILQARANDAYSQKTRLSFNFEETELVKVLDKIEDESEFFFLYNEKLLDTYRKVNITANDQLISVILDDLFTGTDVKYTIIDRKIILAPDYLTEVSQPQQKQITGTVTDETGSPLPGVNIQIEGTTIGAISDANGKYSIDKLNENVVLIFSFIGYNTQKVPASGRTKIDVILVPDVAVLDDVVVIAYGTVKKKDLTGSISTVESKLISSQANSTITRALEGAVAGLQVSAVDGQPGLDMGIRLRGIGTANQNNSNALIVIDGVPAQNDNPLATINSKDIASVTVLKDAASTALYGSRGANGVVLITTKRGSKGATKISFESRLGINQVGPYQYDKISDPNDIYEHAWLAIYNSVRYGVAGSGMAKNYTTNLQNPNMTHEAAAEFASAHLFNYTGSTTATTSRNALGNWMLYDVPGSVYTTTGTGATASATMSGAYLVNTDGKLNPEARLLYKDSYDKYLLENKLRHEYNISATGGTDKVDYFISLGYLEDPSYIRGSKFGRYSGRSNVNAQLYNWLKVGANIAYSWRETQSTATRFGRNPGGVTANPFVFINGQNQLIQLYARDADGNYIYDANGNKKVHAKAGDTYSPLGQTSQATSATDLLYVLDTDQDIRKSSDIISRTYAEVKFLKDFTFTINLGLEKYHETRTRYWNSKTGQAAGTGAFGKVYQNVTVFNTQQLLNYNRDFGKHHVDALAGHEFNTYYFETLYYNSAYELISGFVTFPNFVGHYTGGTFSSPGGAENKNAMESYFGRANYVYDNKYYATVSLRRDGSSKFKFKENRWGTFWSVGGGWRVTGESFMDNTKNWLYNLKVRASYGVIGNQNGIGNYSGYQTWGYGAKYSQTEAGNGIPKSYTLSQGGLPNDALTWENTHTFDAGIDFSLFDRVYGTFDIFNKLTVNAIWGQPIALSLGQGSLEKNSAKIQNRGFEVELNIDIIKQKDFYWSVSLVGSHFRTTLKEVPPGVGSAALDGNWTANADAWVAAGSGASSNITYLRGIGKDYYNLYQFKYGGVDQNTGLPLFYHKVTEADHTAGLYADVAVGGDAKTTNYSTASRYEMGSAIPDWIGGLNTTVKYKGFDFTAMFAYQLGGKYYSNEYGNGMYRSESVGSALSAELIGNTWTPENTGAKFPMVMYGNTYGDGSTFGSWMYTDMALFSASYLNFKNVTLGYTLPDNLLRKYGINAFRLYVSADNLFMITKHSGIDPRMSLVGGYDVGAYAFPSSRTISFGINFDF